jgi:hypothetical protein
MKPFKAKVKAGRLVLDEPTDLPEGTIVALRPDHSWDGLDDEDRARLHAALERSEEDVRAGRVRPAADLFRELGWQR